MSTHRSERLIADVLGEEIAITPSDLVSRTIKKQTMGGYDTNEVDDVLEQAAEALEKLVGRVRELKAVNDEQRARLQEYRDVESALRNALVSSQRFGDDIVENAKREAAVILREARVQQAEAEAEAARLPEAITREIRLLMEERDRIRDDVLAVLEAHRRWVEERVPERDSALSERLLAFVNSRQGVASEEARAAAAEPAPEAPVEPPPAPVEAEVNTDEEDDTALPDVVLEMEVHPVEEEPGEVLEAVADEDGVREHAG